MANKRQTKGKGKAPAQTQVQTRSVGVRVFAIVVAIVLLTVGVCCTGFASRDANGKWFKNGDLSTWHWSNKKEATSDTGDGIQEGSLIVGEYKDVAGARLRSARIAPEDYEAYGISTHTESAVTVTVENIQPENATDKTIEWSYNFSGERVDPEWQEFWDDETWQEVLAGQQSTSVYDFITVTPSEDTHSVIVECTCSFGAPITVTGTFNSNKALKLSFTCNYLAKIENAEFDIRMNMNHSYLAVDTLYLEGLYVVDPEFTLSWGTVFPTVVSDGFSVSVSPIFWEGAPTNMRDFTPQSQTFSGTSVVTDEDFIHGFFGNDFSEDKALAYFNAFCGYAAARRAQTGDNYGDLQFCVTYSVSYNGTQLASETLAKMVKFEQWDIPVSGAEISDSEILF